MKTVSLKQIIDAIETASDEWDQYLDIETMSIVSLPQFDDGIGTNYESLADRIEAGIKIRYFRLPSKYDIHEYSIMEQFINDMPAGRSYNALSTNLSIMLQSCFTYAIIIQKCYNTYCKNHRQRRKAQ